MISSTLKENEGIKPVVTQKVEGITSSPTLMFYLSNHSDLTQNFGEGQLELKQGKALEFVAKQIGTNPETLILLASCFSIYLKSD